MEVKQGKRQILHKKLNKELIDKIVDLCASGVPKSHSALANGLSESMLHFAISQGIDDIEHDKLDTIYAYLVVSLKSKEHKIISESIERIKNKDAGHKGEQWFLEKAYWRYFGQSASEVELNRRIEKLEIEQFNKDKVAEE